jgi:hypothetical protein
LGEKVQMKHVQKIVVKCVEKKPWLQQQLTLFFTKKHMKQKKIQVLRIMMYEQPNVPISKKHRWFYIQ